MSDGTLPSEAKNFETETTKALEDAQQKAKTNLSDALDILMAAEKQARQGSDLASSKRILQGIVTLCKDAGDWKRMDECVQLLSKKHGTLKVAACHLIDTVIGFLNDAPNQDTRLATIEVLRSVTEGKIHLEVQRADVTRILSDILETKGDIKGAAETLCGLQVETFGSMERQKKTEFILRQVELCILTEDWYHANIMSRKVNIKYFDRASPSKIAASKKSAKKADKKADKKASDAMDVDDADSTEDPSKTAEAIAVLKVKFYTQLVTLALQESRYLDACKHYRQILDTDSIRNNAEQSGPYLRRVVSLIILSRHDHEQSDLLHRILKDSSSQLLPEDSALLELFTKAELIQWKEVQVRFGPHLASTDVYSLGENKREPKSFERWQDLEKRVVEHNIRVIAKYYTRITVSRLETLLGLQPGQAEEHVSDLVTSKMVFSRIDRPAGVITFGQSRDEDDLLNEWGSNVKSLLVSLERVDHLITKEEMMASIHPEETVGGKNL